jgi:serine/threonine protein kinase/Tol biopolymer transport system component
MPYPADTQFGPYKIIALIGSGGMGEVYRARDTRLLRDVALKVLPAAFTNDPERLRRFEQEARAVAALNHPNIVSVYDVGAADAVHYIVSELLEGETLRERIPASGMPTRKAIELAVQLANGLAAAHDQGIVHRDLKPENVFVTRTGQLKILDFGLAKLRSTEPLGDGADGATFVATQTDAGQVLGTVGYMSPEQVRGGVVDHRSDIFSFGSILYEMLRGQRAFKRNTGAETMTAILNEDPPEFPASGMAPAPALERIIRHCLEKQPGQRFQSAHDIAFGLESLSGLSSTSTAQPVKARRRWALPLVGALVLAASSLALGAWLRPAPVESHPVLHRMTFRRGNIWNARFTPDGNIIYSASWDGHPPALFMAQPGSTESRSLESGLVHIFAVSPSGELAVGTSHHVLSGFEFASMLARAPRGGGAPRDIVDNIEYADWSPDGASLAVVRRVTGKMRLEYPLGKVLYETPGWVSHARISPDGKLVAFVDHRYLGDDGGAVMTIDAAGNKKTISGQYSSAQGLAWRPDGKEVWFTGTTTGANRELRAASLTGKDRLVYLGTGELTVHDISKDGKVLFSRDDDRSGLIGMAPGATKENDLSWDDWTVPRDLSDDGNLVSFDETGEAGGETGAMYFRRMDGSPAVRLGDGLGPSLSPDGKWVLAMVPGPDGRRKLIEVPTGAGETRAISTGDVSVNVAYFFPDMRHILLLGNAAGSRGMRLWVQDLDGGAPQPISPEGARTRRRGSISPDGKRVAAVGPEGKISIYDVAGGNALSVPGTQDGEEPLQWTADGKGLLVARQEISGRVFLVDLASGQRRLFKSFATPDPIGLIESSPPIFARDLKAYTHSYMRIMSDLYVVEGLK